MNGFMEKIKNNKKIIIYVLMFMIFVLMFILNCNTPLIADDYGYSMLESGKRITNIFQIIPYQYNHYLTWGGRCVNHFIGQTFLMLGKNVFNIANSIGYVLLIYLMYKHCIVGSKKESISLFILINVLLWIFTPVFGESFLWLIGSANYLWSAILVLAFLLLYRKQATKDYDIKDNIWNIIGIGLFGIIAGWTNENTGIAEIAILVMLLIYQKLVNKKKITKWQKVGLITCIIGYIILLAAPGNWIRNDMMVRRSFWLKAYNVTLGLVDLFMPIIIMYGCNAIALNYMMKKNKESDEKINSIFGMSLIYLIGMLGTAYSMACAPFLPYRAYTITTIFMIITLGNLYIYLDFNNRFVKITCYGFISILSVIYMLSYVDAAKDIF